MEDFKRFIAGSGAISLGAVMLLPDLARLLYFLKTSREKAKDEALFNGPMIVLKILYIYFLAERVSHLGDFDLKAEEEDLSEKIKDKDDGAKEKLEDIKKLRKKYDTAQMAMLSALVVMPIAMTLTRMSSSRWRRLAVERQLQKEAEERFSKQIMVESENNEFLVRWPGESNEMQEHNCGENANCDNLSLNKENKQYYDTGIKVTKVEEMIKAKIKQEQARIDKSKTKQAESETKIKKKKEGAEERKKQAQQKRNEAMAAQEALKQDEETDEVVKETEQKIAQVEKGYSDLELKQKQREEEKEAEWKAYVAEQQANVDRIRAKKQEEEEAERIRLEIQREEDDERMKEKKLEALEECSEKKDEREFINCMYKSQLLPYGEEGMAVKRNYLRNIKQLKTDDAKQKHRNDVIAKARYPFDVAKSEAAKKQNALSKEKRIAKEKLDGCLEKFKVNEPRQFVQCVKRKKLIDEEAQNSYVRQLNDKDNKKDEKEGDKEYFNKALRERIASTIRLKHKISSQAEASASPKERKSASSAPPAVSTPKSAPAQEQTKAEEQPKEKPMQQPKATPKATPEATPKASTASPTPSGTSNDDAEGSATSRQNVESKGSAPQKPSSDADNPMAAMLAQIRERRRESPTNDTKQTTAADTSPKKTEAADDKGTSPKSAAKEPALRALVKREMKERREKVGPTSTSPET